MIIVTGATGFIGSNIVADLNAAGRTDIILVDDLGTQAKWKNIAKRRFDDLVLPSELDSLLGKLPGGDAVYHMGANSSTTATDGDAILIGNFRSSKVLWEWCSRTRTPLIYASSAATYGSGTLGFKDDEALDALDALRPLNLYGWSKHAFDKWAVAQSEKGNRPPQWCGLKFFNVYGPNENHKGDMRSLVCKNTASVAGGQTIKLFKSHRDDFADGQQLRDFVYVKGLHEGDALAGEPTARERPFQPGYRPGAVVRRSGAGHRPFTRQARQHRIHRDAGAHSRKLPVFYASPNGQAARGGIRPSVFQPGSGCGGLCSTISGTSGHISLTKI